jgi:mono/diheme cytochrome c family protein
VRRFTGFFFSRRSIATEADVAALYRFFMKQVPPVHRANLKSEIPALLSFRWPVAIWNYFFAPSGSYLAKPGHDAAWNRGAYLVQGPGHCGACHIRPGDRGGHHLHPQWLGQSGHGPHCSPSRQTTQDDRSGQ